LWVEADVAEAGGGQRRCATVIQGVAGRADF